MKDKSSIHVAPSLTALSQQLAERFCKLANEHTKQHGSFHAALSGGNTPQTFFTLLSTEPYRTQLDWQRIHLYIVDERFVPRTHNDSNAGTLMRLLTNRIPLPKSHLHLFETEAITPQQAAENYAAEINKFLPRSDSGHPQFDFILLGTAEDGHIASLFPESESLAVHDKLTTAPYVQKLQSQRLTLTFPAINSATHLFFLVTGQKKAPVIQRVFTDAKPYFPIQMLRPAGSVEWYLDQDPILR